MTDSRVYVHIIGLPSVYKLKISRESPLRHLFSHVPTERHAPPNATGEVDFLFKGEKLDPNATAAQYNLPTGEDHAVDIHVHYHLLPSRATAVGDPLAHTTAEDLTASAVKAIRTRAVAVEEAPLGDVVSHYVLTQSNRDRSSPKARRTPPVSTDPETPEPRPPPVATTMKMDNEMSTQERIEHTRRLKEVSADHIRQAYEEEVRRREEAEVALERNSIKKVDLEQLRARLSVAEEERDRAIDQVKSLREENDDLRAKLARWEGMSPMRAESVSRADEVALLRRQMTQLEGALHLRDSQFGQLRRQIMEKDSEITHLSHEAKQLKDRLAEVDTKAAARGNKIESHMADYDKLQRQVATLAEEKRQLEEKMRRSAQRSVTTEELDGLKQQNMFLQDDKKALEIRVREMKSELDSLREENGRKFAEASQMTHELAELRERFSLAVNANSQSEAELKLKVSQLESELTHIATDNSSMRIAHAQAERERAKVRQLENELHASRASVHQLETSLVECNEVMSRVMKENGELKRINTPRGASRSREVGNTQREQSQGRISVLSGGLMMPPPSIPQRDDAGYFQPQGHHIQMPDPPRQYYHQQHQQPPAPPLTVTTHPGEITVKDIQISFVEQPNRPPSLTGRLASRSQ